MGKPEAPCKGCEKRHPHCHSECTRYKDFCTANDRYSEIVRAEKKKDREYCDFIVCSIDHNLKRHGKRARRRGQI